MQQFYVALELPAKHLRQGGRQTEPRQMARSNFVLIRTAIFLVILICIAPTLNRQSNILQDLQSDYSTAIGEQRQITLNEGSRLLLNTDSAVNVDMNNNVRQVRLLRGEVFFEVDHDVTRPFMVDAGNVHVRVTGTAFSVNYHKKHVVITVAEGRVETSSSVDSVNITSLIPSESVSYDGQQLTRYQTADLRQTLAWRHGQLVFVQAKLADVVAEMNRYRRGQIMIIDTKLSNRLITGVFSINRIDDAITALKQTFGIPTHQFMYYLVLLG